MYNVISRISWAIMVATEVHDEQQRVGSGLPYITHPLAVWREVRNRMFSHQLQESAEIAAILHDTVEDVDKDRRPWLIEALNGGAGYHRLRPLEWKILELLTRQRDGENTRKIYQDPETGPAPWREPYGDYIQRIHNATGEAGMIARIIKNEDMLHNLSDARTYGIVTLEKRYLKYLPILR